MNNTNLQRTAEAWAKPWVTDLSLHWTDLEAVRRRLNAKVSGDEADDWLAYTLRRYFSGRLPLARCYSLGCGHGQIERRLARLGAFVHCEASDLSDGAIAEARRAAAAEGFTNIAYEVADANSLNLPGQAYDAIWAHASVHHFQRLEHVFAQAARALKPGGLFILQEYVGPNRFQFPDYQRRVIQACLDLLPPAYRRIVPATAQARLATAPQRDLRRLARRAVDKWRDGDLLAAVGRRLRLWRAAHSGGGTEKTTANLPTERSVIAVDPSEAVRSAEIVPVLRRYFDIIEYKPLGGTILQFLLAGIAGNFRHDEAGQQLLAMLFHIEDTLMAAGALDSDFAYIVAAPWQLTP